MWDFKLPGGDALAWLGIVLSVLIGVFAAVFANLGARLVAYFDDFLDRVPKRSILQACLAAAGAFNAFVVLGVAVVVDDSFYVAGFATAWFDLRAFAQAALIECIPIFFLFFIFLYFLNNTMSAFVGQGDVVNILTWVGWEELGRRARSRLGFQRYNLTYYNRGLSANAELYDSNGCPYHISIIDAERLVDPTGLSSTSFVGIPPGCQAKMSNLPEPLARTFETAGRQHWFDPIEAMKRGTPVRFGFNEVLFRCHGHASHKLQEIINPSLSRKSLSELQLRDLYERCEEENLHLRVLLWDWYLPSLTLLCGIYCDERKNLTLDRIFHLSETELLKTAALVKKDFEYLHEKKYSNAAQQSFKNLELVSNPKDLRKFIDDADSTVNLIIGFGSTAVTSDADVANYTSYIPIEGVLVWVEFATIRREGIATNPTKAKLQATFMAKNIINKFILHKHAQRHMIHSAPAVGLPTLKAAYTSITQEEVCSRALQTALELENDRGVPLVLRRLPSGKPGVTQPGEAGHRDLWESTWSDLKQAVMRK